jgi:purine-binding chemotaxis protein CheW
MQTHVAADNKINLQQPARWVTFCLEGETYGVNVMHVREVLRLVDITPVPGAPTYILGIINLRGNVVTVIDARKRFGLPPHEPTEASRILVLEADSEVVGFLVDNISEVSDIQPDDIEAAPHLSKEQASNYIIGIANGENDLVILVDLARIATEDRKVHAA